MNPFPMRNIRRYTNHLLGNNHQMALIWQTVLTVFPFLGAILVPPLPQYMLHISEVYRYRFESLVCD